MKSNNNMPANKSVTIIGPGNVGSTLALLACKNNYQVTIGARNLKQAELTSKLIGNNCKAINIKESIIHADLILLTVSDDAIQSVCDDLSQQSAFPDNAVVAHCSGALDSDILLSAKKTANCAIASMHPLQSFPDSKSVLASFSDESSHPGSHYGNPHQVACYYEGSIGALDTIKTFANDLGLKPILISKKAKTLYHIAGVTACNYLSALMDTALETGELAGIDRNTMWQSLSPLITSTLNNINNNGPASALTGPIERGDIATIKRHVNGLLEAHNKTSTISNIYTALGVQTTKLALHKRSISNDTAKKILTELEKLGA